MQIPNLRNAFGNMVVRSSRQVHVSLPVEKSDILNLWTSPLKKYRQNHQLPKTYADKWGISHTTGVLTGHCFSCPGSKKKKKNPSPFAFRFSRGSQMSWVRQRKILNCLLFFSAGTRKGSGERQMSLSLWIKDGQFIKCCCLRHAVPVYPPLFAQGTLFRKY